VTCSEPPNQKLRQRVIAIDKMEKRVAAAHHGRQLYKPLIIFNVAESITLLTDGCTNFRRSLVEGTRPNLEKIQKYVERSLMLVTALSPVIGYDKASKIAHYAE
jgi:fumarate hydratase, class II